MELYRGGHVLYFTGGFPPAQGGSCVLNQNLLKGFDSDSYTVVTYNNYVNWAKVEQGINVYRPVKLFKRLNRLFLPIQKISVIKRLKLFAKRKNAQLIIAAYPDLFFLKLALEVSTQNNIPLVLYLHDTIYEAHKGTKLEESAWRIQKEAFKKAGLVCVMSSGMQKLYADKYKLDSYALRHTFEHTLYEVPNNNRSSKKVLFWGGAVYGINKVSIAKISKLLPRTSFSIELATNASRNALEEFGLDFNKVNLTYYSQTADYWKAITRSKCLLLALDNQHDTEVDFEEISTIFPTKAIEYMFSNVPILLICPSNYFLSVFFREHNCGVVVDDIDDEEAILRALNLIEGIEESIQKKVENAKKIANELFSPSMVRSNFKKMLEQKFLNE